VRSQEEEQEEKRAPLKPAYDANTGKCGHISCFPNRGSSVVTHVSFPGHSIVAILAEARFERFNHAIWPELDNAKHSVDLTPKFGGSCDRPFGGRG
jgi:hypothetical protein